MDIGAALDKVAGYNISGVNIHGQVTFSVHAKAVDMASALNCAIHMNTAQSAMTFDTPTWGEGETVEIHIRKVRHD
jgi:hypothetical protein